MDYFSGNVAQGLLNQAAPNWNFNHISDRLLPAVQEAGVSDAAIDVMLVGNPRRYIGVCQAVGRALTTRSPSGVCMT